MKIQRIDHLGKLSLLAPSSHAAVLHCTITYQTPYDNVDYPLDDSLWMGCSTETPGYWTIRFCALHQMYSVLKF